MRAALVQSLWGEQHGLLLLAEILGRRGHEVRFFQGERGWLGRLGAWRPDVVGLSSTTGGHRRDLAMADRIKRELDPAPIVVMGGAHPTFFPEVIRHPSLDAICQGEGELVFPRFLEAIVDRRMPVDVPGFRVKQDGEIHCNDIGPLVADLDSLPFARRLELYRDYPFLRESPVRTVLTGRGCRFNCSFCFNHAYRKMVTGKGPYLRRRSVDHVLAELEYLKREHGFRHLEFIDDDFTLGKEWFLEFAWRYRVAIGTSYQCLLHPGHVDDDIAEALKESGCTFVLFGVESGSERVRSQIMNRVMSNDDIRACADRLRRRGLPFQTFNMVGLPGETLDEAFETVRLNQELRPKFAWCSVATPYPGTRLAGLCSDLGLLPAGATVDELVPTSFFDRSALDVPNRRALTNLQKVFDLAVQAPRVVRWIRPFLGWPAARLFRLIHLWRFGRHARRRSRLGWWYLVRLYVRNRSFYA